MQDTCNSKEILVVEDDEEFLNLIVLNLESKGVSIDYAKSVDEAIQLLSKNTYKTISLDVFLGQENCGKILQHLKQVHKDDKDHLNSQADIIICSAFANDDFIARMITKGYKVFPKQTALDKYFAYLGKLTEKDLKDEFAKTLDEFFV